MKFVTFRKNWHFFKWYGGIVQNLGKMTKILADFCTFNYNSICSMQRNFSIVNAKCLGAHFFWTHCSFTHTLTGFGQLIYFVHNVHFLLSETFGDCIDCWGQFTCLKGHLSKTYRHRVRIRTRLGLGLGLGLASNFRICTTPFRTNDPSDKWPVTFMVWTSLTSAKVTASNNWSLFVCLPGV